MRTRTKWIIGVLGIFIAGGIAYAATHRASGVMVTNETVKRGTIKQTVEVTGDTQSVKDLDLAFNTSGTIAVINKEIGDTVKAGDVLAALSEAKIAASLSQAADAVDQAQAALNVKRAGATPEEIAVYTTNVSAAEAALESSTLETAQTKMTGDTNVAIATDDVAHTLSSTAESLSHAQQDAHEAIRALVAEIRNALGKADAVLGIENNFVNADFDQDLGIQDPGSVASASDAFRTAATSRNSAEDILVLVDLLNPTTLTAAANAAQTAYQDTYTTLIDTSRVLDATTGGSASLSLSDLSTMKTSITSATSSLTANGSALTNAEQALEGAVRAQTDDVKDAQNALGKAQAIRDQNNTAAASALALRESDLAKAQAQLAQIAAMPRSVDLAGLEAAVAISQAQYSAALANAADAKIISPINGLVTAVNADIGEQAAIGSTIITLLGTSDQFEIVLNIPEADIAKIHIGQKSVITFDAFGDEREFNGSVLTINPAEKLIEGVVFYESKIILDSGTNISDVKSGMSANVIINTNEVTGALFIPKRAILQDSNGKYVRIPKSVAGEFDRRSVTVGLYGDDGSAEILSGLSEGETVIVTIR